jgi:hypothetical protein
MKAYIRSRGAVPLILNIDAEWRSVVNNTPGPIGLQKGTPLLIVRDPGRIPSLFGSFVENFEPTGIRNPEISSS